MRRPAALLAALLVLVVGIALVVLVPGLTGARAPAPGPPTATPASPSPTGPTGPTAPATAPPTPEPVAVPSEPPPTEPTAPGHDPRPDPVIDPARPLAGVVVALDPGHNRDNGRHPETRRPVDAGGSTKECNTTGTASPDGITESSHNWALAGLLAERLRGLGAEVPMTRDADAGWGPCVDARGRFGAEAGADLMVSLHADGSTTAGHHGFHIITPGVLPGWTDDVAGPSAHLARSLRDALVAGGWPTSTYRGTDGIDVRTDLGTLNWADVPTVVVETHNMHDPGDAERLHSAEGRARLADALATGVVRFVEDLPRG